MKGVKRMKLVKVLLSLLLVMGIGASPVLADVPMTVSYQCSLVSSGATDLTKVDMTFLLYASDKSSVNWQETITDIDVNNGIVSVTLGESNDLTQAIIDSSEYIGVKVNDNDVMQPLTKLNSSMYAMRAAFADRFTQGAVAFDSSNLSPNIIEGAALKSDTITSDKIADGAVTAADIADNAITSQKITTSITTVDAEEITSVNKDYYLQKEDQGLILVSGDVDIYLATPGPENEGERYTIKKIDDGLQRPCEKSCEVLTDKVTIKCGSYTDDINGTMLIENRTNQIYLEYKNSFVTLVSNGSFWYIVESNPPQDIFAPVPGNNGNMDNVVLLANTPVNLSWTKATDCDRRSCDTCDEQLYYMPFFSKGDKLTSLEIIRESGFPCLNQWLTPDPSQNLITTTCDTSLTEENYTGTFKVTVVVKDKAGNIAAYCPPGDNIAPSFTANGGYFWTSPYPTSVNLLWDLADDDGSEGDPIEGTTQDLLTYSIYYTDSPDGKACLANLDKNEPNTGEPCNIKQPNIKQNATEIWSPVERGTNIHKMANETQATVDVIGLQPSTFYYFTIVVEDQAANKKQYDIIGTSTAAQ